MASEAPVTILQKRSGIVQAIGFWGAVLFGIHCISLSSSGFIPFSWIASVWPGADIKLVLTLAAGLSLIHGYAFAIIGAAVPRSGADYVLGSRVFGLRPAFAASWVLLLASGLVAGGLVAWIPKSALPALLQPMSIIFGDPKYAVWASYCASPYGSLFIGAICILLVTVTMFFRTERLLTLFNLGLVMGVAAWIVIYWSLLSSPGPEHFRAQWDHFMGNMPMGHFNDRIALAKASGMEVSHSLKAMTFGGLIMGFWVYYGYFIPTFFAGDLKKRSAGRPLLLASWTSVVVSWLIFFLGVYFLEKLVSEQWIAAEGYLFNNGEAVSKVAGREIPAFPWITFYAAILKPSPFWIFFTAVAWIFTLLNLVQTYFFYSSRIVLAWGLDGIIPEFFTVPSRTDTPKYCIIAIAVLAFIGVYDASFGGPLGAQLIFVLFAILTQIITVSALIFFPFKMPEQFRTSLPFVRRTIFKIPVATIIGVLSLMYLISMLVASFIYPGALGLNYPIKTGILLAVFLISGLFVYWAADRYRRKHNGYSLSALRKIMPPE
jgi:amino acid transporter